jgi:hypothetical protein
VSGGHLALRSGLRAQPPAQPIAVKVRVQHVTDASSADQPTTRATITIKSGG